MFKSVVAGLGLCISLVSEAKLIKVALIDTGITQFAEVPTCGVHKDFTGEGITDTNGHGTNVAYLIKEHAGSASFCIIPVKYYSARTENLNFKRSLQALLWATAYKVDVIVYAGGGPKPDAEEKAIITKALDFGTKFVVAAGNNAHDLDQSCSYYPACYDERITVAGCAHNGKRCSFSNYGKIVDVIEDGMLISAGGYTLSGTSQSTAIAAGKLINKLSKEVNGTYRGHNVNGADSGDPRSPNRGQAASGSR